MTWFKIFNGFSPTVILRNAPQDGFAGLEVTKNLIQRKKTRFFSHPVWAGAAGQESRDQDDKDCYDFATMIFL
jgi:hypothetical protein